MRWRTFGPLFIVSLGLASSGVAALLADAAEQHDAAKVRAMLETGEDVNTAQADGTTALHWAAFHDDAEMVGSSGRAPMRTP